jgi:hypothetical protein
MSPRQREPWFMVHGPDLNIDMSYWPEENRIHVWYEYYMLNSQLVGRWALSSFYRVGSADFGCW